MAAVAKQDNSVNGREGGVEVEQGWEGVEIEREEGFLRPLEQRPCRGVQEGGVIPVIDVGAAVSAGVNPAARRALLAQVKHACQEWGFFHVANHGIPLSLIHRLRQASKEFFQLPSEVKLQVKKHAGGLGYYQGQLTNNIRDWREVFDMSACGYLELPHTDPLTNKVGTKIFHNQWPSDAIREICEEYMREAKRLAFTLTKLMWESLGLPPTRFEDYFGQSKTHRFRFNHYPVCSTPDLVLGVGAHTDVGALTVLLQDEVGGLQIKQKDGQWLDVHPDPTSPVINVADVMQVLTNDKYRSVEHRVVVNRKVDRYSFSYSYNAASGIDVAPISELVNENNPPKYKPINWGKYTMLRIDSSLNTLEFEHTTLRSFCWDVGGFVLGGRLNSGGDIGGVALPPSALSCHHCVVPKHQQ
ncbi:hypothetical protein GOP47_0025390 [Adiantum capillus-veneris]|uniref:Fe2OG dioxygenase domain-containing protein n=1 Tax=Adiantum capillus-veneris TaxID=13818 RepID=A0A9D4U2P8_ADICA|nr:hypothetical protein GOP47_0025390 [Adiantum capillus-veneris]